MSALRSYLIILGFSVLTSGVAWGQAPVPTPGATNPEALAAPPAQKKKPVKKSRKAGEVAGQRTLVDALDEKVPLEVGVQLRIFKQARKRKLEIERREGELSRRSARLTGLIKDVETRYKTLRMVQEELAASTESEGDIPEEDAVKAAAKDDKERAQKVAKLSKVLNKMKADEAAKMIPVMEEDLVVEVMSRLKPKQAAKILGKIDPTLAARLTGKMTTTTRGKKKKRP